MTDVTTIEMTTVEENRLVELENIVTAGLNTFIEVGSALAEIRDRKLYRATHSTFEAYLAEQWQIGRARGYRLIEAANIARAVSPMGDIRNERQARELVGLSNEQARETYQRAVAETAGRPTAKAIRTTRQRTLPKTIEPHPLYKVSSTIGSSTIWLGMMRQDNAENRFANDVHDAIAADDQDWLKVARAVIAEVHEYAARLTAVLEEDGARERAITDPSRRDDCADLFTATPVRAAEPRTVTVAYLERSAQFQGHPGAVYAATKAAGVKNVMRHPTDKTITLVPVQDGPIVEEKLAAAGYTLVQIPDGAA